MDELRPGHRRRGVPAGAARRRRAVPAGGGRPGPRAAGHSTQEELLLLTTHGILHLLGYDHAEPDGGEGDVRRCSGAAAHLPRHPRPDGRAVALSLRSPHGVVLVAARALRRPGRGRGTSRRARPRWPGSPAGPRRRAAPRGGTPRRGGAGDPGRPTTRPGDSVAPLCGVLVRDPAPRSPARWSTLVVLDRALGWHARWQHPGRDRSSCSVAVVRPRRGRAPHPGSPARRLRRAGRRAGGAVGADPGARPAGAARWSSSATRLTPGKRLPRRPVRVRGRAARARRHRGESQVIEADEREMIHSVFELGDTTVTREVMVPRTDAGLGRLTAQEPAGRAMSLFLRSGFSRVPVIGDGSGRRARHRSTSRTSPAGLHEAPDAAAHGSTSRR